MTDLTMVPHRCLCGGWIGATCHYLPDPGGPATSWADHLFARAIITPIRNHHTPETTCNQGKLACPSLSESFSASLLSV